MNSFIDLLQNLDIVSFWLGFFYSTVISFICSLCEYFIQRAFKERRARVAFKKCIKCEHFNECDFVEESGKEL